MKRYHLNKRKFRALHKKYGFTFAQVAEGCGVSSACISSRNTGRYLLKNVQDADKMLRVVQDLIKPETVQFDDLFYPASKTGRDKNAVPKAKRRVHKKTKTSRACNGCVLSKSEKEGVIGALQEAKATLVLSLAEGTGHLDRKALKAADSISVALADVEKIKTS